MTDPKPRAPGGANSSEVSQLVKAALATFVIACVLGLPVIQAEAGTPCGGIRWKGPYYQTGDTRPVRQIIRCAVERWHVEGGVQKAFNVFRCESGFRPDAINHLGPYLGVAQLDSWETRRARYLRRQWDFGARVPWSNARANVIVAIRIVHLGDWSPWSCA